MSNTIKIGDTYVKASSVVLFEVLQYPLRTDGRNYYICLHLAGVGQVPASPSLTKEQAEQISKEILDAWEEEGG